jgi:acyl carrier protein
VISISYLFENEDLKKLVYAQTKDSMGRSDIKLRNIKSESHYYDDLGYDELDKQQLVIDIENKFGEMTDKQYSHFMKNIHTVGDTIDFVKKLKNKQKVK